MTSTLQRHFFPQLCKENGWLYNPKQFLSIKSNYMHYTKEDKALLGQVLKHNNVLISSEDLLGYNPHYWKEDIARVRDLFGSDAKIVITVRNYVSIISSIFVQSIQQGFISNEKEFFVNSRQYERAKDFISRKSFVHLDYEVDYCVLEAWLMMRLNKCIFFHIQMANLYPWHLFFDDLIKRTTKALALPVVNKSYSVIALKLTLLREQFLNTFGLSTLTSQNIQMRKMS